MFCKWCGAKIDSTQRTCFACGHELPPLSECGGFNNIVSQIPKSTNQADYSTPQAARPSNAEPPSREKHRKVEASKRSLVVTMSFHVILVVSIVLLISLKMDIEDLGEQKAASEGEIAIAQSELAGKIDSIMQANDSITEKIDGLQSAIEMSAAQEESSEPEVKPTLKTEKLSFEVFLDEGGSLKSTYSNLGAYSSDVTFQCDASEEYSDGVSLKCSVDDSETVFWQVQILETTEEERSQLSCQFKSDYVDQDQYEMVWKFRDEGTEQWIDCSLEPTIFSNGADEDELEIDLQAANGYFSDESIEIRCTITQEDPQGGALTVLFSKPVAISQDQSVMGNGNDGYSQTEQTTNF